MSAVPFLYALQRNDEGSYIEKIDITSMLDRVPNPPGLNAIGAKVTSSLSVL